MVRDIRYAFRTLCRNPAVSLSAVVSLALAVGACTAAFSLLDALVLRPLPVAAPHALFWLAYPERIGGRSADNDSFSYPAFLEFRAAAAKQADLFAVTFGGGRTPVVVDAGADAEPVRAQSISGNGFPVLGIRPALGRLPDDDRRPVAVLGYDYWMRRFGGSASAIGRWITVAGKPYQIGAVAPQGFSGLEPGLLTDVWVPLAAAADDRALHNPAGQWLAIWGRPHTGVRPEQIGAMLQPLFATFRAEVARKYEGRASADELQTFAKAGLLVKPAATGHTSLFRGQFERPLWILGMVAGLVLLICCANLANLFAARAAAREREMALRAAIGAGRLRLIRQVLAEGVLVASAACVLGLIFSAAAAPMIVNRLAPSTYPAYLDLRFDGRMLAFVAGLGGVTVLLFGLIPAWRASGVAPHDALKAGSSKHSARGGVLKPLLVAQAGFSFMVLFLCGLLLVSFQKLTSVDLGFSKDGVVLFTIRPAGSPQTDPGPLLDRLRSMPQVRSAGLSTWGLVAGPFAPIWMQQIRLPGHDWERGPQFLAVSPGFFGTMQIRLLEGRDFAAHDPAAVIVNQSFARRYFPGESAIGRHFDLMEGEDAHAVVKEIVGVVHDSKYNNVREPPSPSVYLPLEGMRGTLEVRAAGDPRRAAAELRPVIQRFAQVTGVTLQSTQIDDTLLRERLLAMVAGFFAIIAMALAAVGLYGVLSYTVVRRTREIGIRMALGAETGAVVRMIFRELLLVLAIGVALGVAGGREVAAYFAGVLFEVKPSDTAALALPLAVLLLVLALAAVAPALRAARVDPVEALRCE